MTSPLPSLLSDEPTDHERWHSLTEQERKVLALAAQPMSNKLVAVELTVSERTVERSISNAADKLGVPQGQGKQTTLREYRRIAGHVGKSDDGFAPLETQSPPVNSLSRDVIEIPLAKFDEPAVRQWFKPSCSHHAWRLWITSTAFGRASWVCWRSRSD